MKTISPFLGLIAPILLFVSVHQGRAEEAPADILDDLRSDDAKRIFLACEKAIDYPSPEMVRTLMGLALADDPSDRMSRLYGDEGYPEPCTSAIVALSKIVPNPATTFTSPHHQHRYPEPYVHYVELWEEWWENNRQDYENPDARMPERPADSLLNLSKEDRNAREMAVYAANSAIMGQFVLKLRTEPHMTFDPSAVEYLAERRQARAIARALADREDAARDPEIAISAGSDPPVPVSDGHFNLPASWPWIAGVGCLLLVVGATVTLYFHRRKSEVSA